jgi:hypothetical protein
VTTYAGIAISAYTYKSLVTMTSRWQNKPDGKRPSIRPDTDIPILKDFGRHGVLTTNDIAALEGRTYDPIRRRLTLVKYEGLITVHATQLQQPHLWQRAPQAFHLTPKGEARLRELGVEPRERPSNHFLHSLAQSQTSASFEIGARESGLDYVQLDHAPITINDHRIYPDGGPVGLGKNNLWRFAFWETDCATEPLTSKKDRQNIEAKFRAYLAFLGQGAYQTIFGVPNASILFTTTTKARLESMRALLHSMTADYLNCFRFFVLPTLAQQTTKPPPGWAATHTQLAP